MSNKEPKCKTSPLCSHNRNGRDLSKPCSIEFEPMNNEEWEEEYESLLRLFLVQQLAWEKSIDKDMLIKSPVLQEIVEKKYNQLKSFIRTKLEEAYQRGLDSKKGERHRIGYQTGYNEGYQAGMEHMKKAAIEAVKTFTGLEPVVSRLESLPITDTKI